MSDGNVNLAYLSPVTVALLVPACGIASLYSWLTIAHFVRKVKTNVAAIPDIYCQPGFYYPLKYYAFRIILWLRKRQNNQRLKSKEASSSGAGYGVKSRNSPEEMDRVQEFNDGFPMAVDAVYFNGVNQDGAYFVAATARRPENFVNAVLCLHLPEVGVLMGPSMPDTTVQDEKSKSAFTAGGLLIQPVKCMEAWSISYDGHMRKAKTGERVKVSFNLLWKACTRIFDFDTDMHPHAMAAAIARETWTKEFFDTLKAAHQTHYEQFGEITGTVQVEGYPDQQLKVQGMRDHSYGNIRDWKSIHRYNMNFAYLEDGSCIFVGTICMPSMLSRLDFGYVFHPNGEMDSAAYTDFEFYNWGDKGVTPDFFEVNFVAGGKKYNMKCYKDDIFYFYMGKDWEAKIHERVCHYTVNGVKGWGISEWDYRNYAGKEAEMAWVEQENQRKKDELKRQD